MRSRAALVIFTWAVAEFLLFGWIVSVLGLGTVVGVSLVKAAIGLMLMRRNARGLVRDGLAQRTVPQRALLAVAGALLVIPGLVSGVLGALLVVPPVRAALWSRLSARIAQFVPSRFGGVVDVSVVNEDITKVDRRLGGASELR
jgi:UPF0716 protein FxsA